MWSLGEEGLIAIPISLLEVSNVDNLTHLVCEAFGNSIRRNDVPTIPVEDTPDDLSESISKLTKTPGGCQFLAFARVVITAIGSFDASSAIQAILRKTTTTTNWHLIPRTEQLWPFLEIVRKDFPSEISSQRKGSPPLIVSDDSAKSLEVHGTGAKLGLECVLNLKKFLDTLYEWQQFQLQTHVSSQGSVDFELRLDSVVITGAGKLDKFDVQITGGL